MDIDQFIDVVQKFAANPHDVDYDKATLTADIRNEIIELTFRKKQGQLYCLENEREYSAPEWIMQRLGLLETLARQILDHIPQDDLLIPVASTFVSSLESKNSSPEYVVDDTLTELRNFLSNEHMPAGMTNVVYLTSDAGEGKTSLLEALARSQARAYLDRKTDWLLLPVWLGGRSFIRLDDIIIGTLANRLRFPFYYYESVIELIKLEAIVLGLDGFEEMFIINPQTGDAVSSLGTLVSKLNSNGRLLVAARSAYYNYRTRSQAQFFQAINRENYVTFAEVQIKRWTEDHFYQLAQKATLSPEDEARRLYNTVSKALKPEHPLLTRAILARKLIETYKDKDETDRTRLIQRLSSATSGTYFQEFVNALLEREVHEKWIDRAGEAAKPLLLVEEHHAILAAIAEEMWVNSVEALNRDLIELVTELTVSELLHKTPLIVEQAKNRITAHALLRLIKGTKAYTFDHEEFKNFFLGCKIASLLSSEDLDRYKIRNFFRLKTFPSFAVEVCAAQLPRTETFAQNLGEALSQIAKTTLRASYVRQNVGSILMRVASNPDRPQKPMHIHHAHFNASSLEAVKLTKVKFEACIFEQTGLAEASFQSVQFEKCEFLHLEINASLKGVQLDQQSLPRSISVSDGVGEKYYYAPQDIIAILQKYGITVLGEPEKQTHQIQEEDTEIILAHRIFRYFQRSTALNENVLRTKFGKEWPRVDKDVLPFLLEANILLPDDYKGRGDQRRFRLGLNFDEAAQIRQDSQGKFDQYIALAKQTLTS